MVAKVAKENFDATSDPECGHRKREKVRPYFCRMVPLFTECNSRFPMSANLLVRYSLKLGRFCQEDAHGGLEDHRILGNKSIKKEANDVWEQIEEHKCQELSCVKF